MSGILFCLFGSAQTLSVIPSRLFLVFGRWASTSAFFLGNKRYWTSARRAWSFYRDNFSSSTGPKRCPSFECVWSEPGLQDLRPLDISQVSWMCLMCVCSSKPLVSAESGFTAKIQALTNVGFLFTPPFTEISGIACHFYWYTLSVQFSGTVKYHNPVDDLVESDAIT